MPTEIYKFDGQTWLPIVEIQYTDDTLTDRDIIEVHYNDNGTFRQVFGAGVAAETLVWAASTPTGTYTAGITVPGRIATMAIGIDTAGAFSFLFLETNENAGGAPEFGTYRPGLTGIDASSYEVSVNASSVTGTGTRSGVGSMSVIDGTFQALNGTGNLIMTAGPFGGGNISVTLEIREIALPSNTTGPATFVMRANAN